MKKGVNVRACSFPKRPKLYISSLKLASFAGSGVKIRFNQRRGTLTQGPKIVISSQGPENAMLANKVTILFYLE